jgi:ubiquinone/menaquinone biosynthesis C-methylase UbiE
MDRTDRSHGAITRSGARQGQGPATGPTTVEARERVAALYSSVAPDYEALGPPFFAHAGRRLVELAGIAPGSAVLDVAAGRGAVLFPAAERVGPGGRVVGIDLAAGMVEHTAQAIARRGPAHAEMRRMDAEALAFPDASFDAVLCSFAIFWFPDTHRALQEMRRVLKPGGTVGFAFSRGRDPRWRWYDDLLRTFGALHDLPPLPGHSAIRREGALPAALADTGFEALREVVEETELSFVDEETWWRSLWTHGARIPLERLPPDEVHRFKLACVPHLRALKTPAGLPERHGFVYVTGRAPYAPSLRCAASL